MTHRVLEGEGTLVARLSSHRPTHKPSVRVRHAEHSTLLSPNGRPARSRPAGARPRCALAGSECRPRRSSHPPQPPETDGKSGVTRVRPLSTSTPSAGRVLSVSLTPHLLGLGKHPAVPVAPRLVQRAAPGVLLALLRHLHPCRQVWHDACNEEAALTPHAESGKHALLSVLSPQQAGARPRCASARAACRPRRSSPSPGSAASAPHRPGTR